jgi:hypothetical protein
VSNADVLADKNEDSRMISDKGANDNDSPQKRSLMLDDKDKASI